MRPGVTACSPASRLIRSQPGTGPGLTALARQSSRWRRLRSCRSCGRSSSGRRCEPCSASPRPQFSFETAFANRQIVLVRLPTGLLGPELTAFLGSLIMSKIWTAAQSRIGLSQEKRHPAFVIVDEVERFVHGLTDLGDVSGGFSRARCGLGAGTPTSGAVGAKPSGCRACQRAVEDLLPSFGSRTPQRWPESLDRA